jgi:hypothetical protein
MLLPIALWTALDLFRPCYSDKDSKNLGSLEMVLALQPLGCSKAFQKVEE